MPNRTKPLPHLRRPLAILAAGVIALLGLPLILRWDRQVEERLARWAAAEVAQRTGGAYRLVLGDLSLMPLTGSIAFDSAIVTTDSLRNRRRAKPLPMLEGRAHGCRLRGLDVVRLLLLKSFVARELGCRRGAADIALVSGADEESRPDPDTAGGRGPTEEPTRLLGLSSRSVGTVSFPAISVRLERPGERGPGTVALDSARFEANDLEFDPAAEEGRILSADLARLTGKGLLMRPDTLIEMTAAGMEAEFTDSTLRIAGVSHEPAIPEDEWVRRVQVRRDRIRFALDSLYGRGVAWRAFLATGDIGLRSLELRGPRLDVLTDKRIPAGPSRHRTPQQVAASWRGPALRLDTVQVTGGTILYREREPEPEHEAPGVITFEGLRATILHLHLPPRGEPLRIEGRARLMGEGLLSTGASVPLDASDFRYELSGELEQMPAEALNRFLAETQGFKFDGGWVEQIVFRQTAEDGRAVATVTPSYRELSVEPTGEGGVIGAVTGAVEELAADAFVVRSRNPGEDGGKLRTGRAVRRYDPTNTWLQFIWFGLRDALMDVLKE